MPSRPIGWACGRGARLRVEDLKILIVFLAR